MNRIVDQVVNPKIRPTIDPEVETIICNYFGVDKPSESEGKGCCYSAKHRCYTCPFQIFKTGT